jgi:hypothetical protein
LELTEVTGVRWLESFQLLPESAQFEGVVGGVATGV